MAEQPWAGVPMGARLKGVVMRAIDEAVHSGASSVEAEHLLLSIAANDDLASRTLDEFGLDHAGIQPPCAASASARCAPRASAGRRGTPAVDPGLPTRLGRLDP